jgi:hypothetical protein
MAKNKDDDLKDIFEDGRSFELSDGTKYYIVPPEAEHIRKADWTYSKIYNKAFVDGVTTIAEMRDALEARGLIGTEFDDKIEEMRLELESLVDKMETAEDPDKKRILANKVAAQRDRIFAWNQRASSPLSQTCESIADDARIEYFTSCMVVDEDGERVWDSYDEFLQDKNQELALQARFSCMLFMQGLDDNFLEQMPENIALKELDEAETIVEEKEEKPKPKRKTKAKKKSK